MPGEVSAPLATIKQTKPSGSWKDERPAHSTPTLSTTMQWYTDGPFGYGQNGSGGAHGDDRGVEPVDGRRERDRDGRIGRSQRAHAQPQEHLLVIADDERAG